MSFGLRDADWVDPPEEPTFRAHCRDCTHFDGCPCGCGYGWCSEIGEHVDGFGVVIVGEDCETFDASASFDPAWEEWERGDQLYDAMKDRQMEEE